MDYLPFTYGVRGRSLREASPEEARTAYRNFLASIDDRLAQLARLVGESGLRLDLTDASVDDLEQWFVSNIERHLDDPRKLSRITNSLAIDLGIYFGEVMIRRSPALAWLQWPDSASPMFQRQVISFSEVDTRDGWGVDICMLVASYGLQYIDGNNPEKRFFSRLIREVVEAAE
ncbi:DUF6278 family protein [Micromonospora sp. NPDC047548]|uniref:DUF6278 family protein n=1 Tax=Micromonospora sp. NPDC047548 TaxID=3155624 RepID=UPI0033D84101